MKWGKKDEDSRSLRSMLEGLKKQQGQLVESIHHDQDESGNRVSIVLSDLETYVAELEKIVGRLADVTAALVEQSDARIKPWYVRLFCP